MQDAKDEEIKRGGKFGPKAKFAGALFLCVSFWLTNHINWKWEAKIPATSRAHGIISKQRYHHCNAELAAEKKKN